MSQIELHIDEVRGVFLLTGETGVLLANRRAKYFLFNTLKALLDENNSIVIKFGSNRESLLRNLHHAFEIYGINVIDSTEVKNALKHYFIEGLAFKTFSEKAKSIWRNELDRDDFEKFKNTIASSLPTRVLYDKQLLAAFHLAFAQNACNFSVPGTGKTTIVYAAYSYLKGLSTSDEKYVNQLLIVGPLSSFGPWVDEYKECFGVEPTVKKLSGGLNPIERERYLLSVTPLEDSPEITLISYQSAANNLQNLCHFLERSDRRVMIVLDEAHKIKNIDGGKWATAILSLAKQNSIRSRVVLTGTPLPNGYEDVYNLYDFIWPGKEIVNFNISQLREMSKDKFDTRVKELIENISPFFVRIRKRDVLNPALYPIIENPPIYVSMGDVQAEIYYAIEKKYFNYFEEQESRVSVTAQLTKARFIRLMQAASNPLLLKDSLDRYFTDEGLSSDLYIDDRAIIERIVNYKEIGGSNPKMVELVRLVKEIVEKGEKAVVWATFIKNVNEIQSVLKENGIESERLIGEVPIESDETAGDVLTREKIIREFHNPNSYFKVIIANPFAVAESISLHKVCHNAIYFERTFNAANFIQSKDRIHRVGLAKNTTTQYYYILTSDTIEETIHKRLIEKEERMLELIESREIPLFAQNLNYDIDLIDDIKSMIRDYVKRSAKV